MINGYGNACKNILAVALIVAGIVILLASIPCWLWLTALGIVMITIGVILLKPRW